MIEAVSASETSVNLYETTQNSIPEGCHLPTRRHANLKFLKTDSRFMNFQDKNTNTIAPTKKKIRRRSFIRKSKHRKHPNNVMIEGRFGVVQQKIVYPEYPGLAISKKSFIRSWPGPGHSG
jgi:hypothetical protein